MNQNPDLLWIARYDYKTDWTLRVHKHDYYQIIYILEGDVTVEINDNEFFVHADSILFIPPGDSHGLKGVCKNGIKTLDAKFRIEENDNLFDSLNDLPVIIEDTNHRIKVLLEMIREEGLKKKIMPYQYVYCLIRASTHSHL